MRIIFEAHADSLDNEAGRASGWNDVDLSETGVRQAKELGQRHQDDLPQAVYCSDLLRSYKTAVIAFEGTNTPIIADRRLREWDYGQFASKPRQEVDEMRSRHIKTPFPGGESYDDISRRILEFIEDLRQTGHRRVIIVGHRATQYGLEEHLQQAAIADMLAKKFVWQPGWQYNA